MSEPDDRDPRWSEAEVSLILKRALELQQEEQRQPTTALKRADGASLADLEEMAREVGIEPALVRRAATEIEARPRPVEVSRFTGGPGRIVLTRVLHGEAPQAAIETLLGVVQETLGEHGQPSMIGRTFTWTSLNASGRHASRRRQISITVAPRDGVTTIRVEEQLRGTAAAMFGGMLVGIGGGSSGAAMGIGIGALHSPLLAVLIWLFTLTSAYGGVRGLYARTVRIRTAELQKVIARVVEHVQAALDAAALPAHANRRALPK